MPGRLQHWILARKCLSLWVLTLCILFIGLASAYEVLRGPTEMRYWEQEKAYEGYTLFAASGTTYLIDMMGRVAKVWRIGTNPRLLDSGNLLDASKDDPSGFNGFKELDWDGNLVWEYYENRQGYSPHHDFVRIFNSKLGKPTTLYIANKSISHDEAIAAGCKPANGPYNGAQMDAIVEVDMEGNVVWEWWFFDHVVQDIDPSKENYGTISENPGKINLNLPGRPLKRDWLHCNSLDYNAQLDQIVTNSVQGEFYVIDHGNTFIAGNPSASIALAAGPAGDFLYRFGDPARYDQGEPPSILEDWTTSTTGNKQIGGSHDIQWIKPGLPGAGNFLVFNNGQYLFERTPQSYVFEIDGFLNSNGSTTGGYVNPPEADYYRLESPKDTHKSPKLISNQVIWIYRSKSNQAFFSHIGSGAQRLPNGNTLVCSDTEGHIFEITEEGEVVWEYINPVTKQREIFEILPDSLPMTNSVFRAYRYAADSPPLTGKMLIPGATITGRDPSQLPSLRARESASEVVFPHYASGGTEVLGSKTRIIIRNGSGFAESGNIFFRDGLGQNTEVSIDQTLTDSVPFSLEPWGTLDIETDRIGDLRTGSIEVVSDLGAASKIRGTEIFDVFGRLVSVDAAPFRSAHQVYVSISAEESTGIAVYNPDLSARVKLDVFLLDSNGIEQTRTQIVLEPGQQLARFVEEAELLGEFFQNRHDPFKGTLNIVEVDKIPICVIGLIQKKASGALIAVSTSPYVYSP